MTLGQSDNALIKLIAISIIVYVGLAFMKAVWYFTYQKELVPALFNKDIMNLFVMPADFNKILSRPWTIITHMFVHDNFWVVFANMLWLWCFGYIMQDLTGNKKIIPLFIYGSIAGAAEFSVSYILSPALKTALRSAVSLGA